MRTGNIAQLPLYQFSRRSGPSINSTLTCAFLSSSQAALKASSFDGYSKYDVLGAEHFHPTCTTSKVRSPFFFPLAPMALAVTLQLP